MSGSNTPESSIEGQSMLSAQGDMETSNDAAPNDQAEVDPPHVIGKDKETRKSRSNSKKNSCGDDDLKENKQRLQINKLQTELKAVKKQNEKYKKEVTDLSVQCTSMAVEKKQREAEIVNLRLQHESAISNLHQQWDATKQEIADMARDNELEVTELRENNESAQTLLRIENTRLNDELTKLTKDKENVLHNSANAKIKSLESQNKQLKDNLSSLQRDINKMQSTINTLQIEKSEAIAKSNETIRNESKLQNDLEAVNQLLEASEIDRKKLEKLLQECESEKNELLEHLDNSNYGTEPQAKPRALVIYDNVMEKVAKNLDDKFTWTYRTTTISEMKTSDYIEAFDLADLVLFLIGSSDIRGGTKGLDAFGKLRRVVEAAKDRSKVVIAEIAPTCKRGAAGHVSVFNYKLSKMQDVTVIASNPKMVKDELLNENDELCEVAVTTIVKKINQELLPPETLKTLAATKPETDSTCTVNEFVELKSNQVGRVIGQRGTTITSLTRKFDVTMRIGKWGEPKKDNKDNIEMKTDGVIVTGLASNVFNVINEIRKILDKEYVK
jgi:myosin heavy subunit